jgi:glycosyltransferase involved in cell wall biosynthesis
MKYKISIIIPVFNVENYIKDALESVIRQTIGFKNLEVIMVDDCSTDKSGEIIDHYANKYENFIAIHSSQNSGFAGTPRNIGMEKATSDFIMFLDADDIYKEDICEVYYNKIISEDVDIVSGSYNLLEYGKLTKICFDSKGFKNVDIVNVDSIDDNINLLRLPPMMWTKIFRKILIEENKIKFTTDNPCEDLVFVLNAFLSAKGIIFINNYEPYYYRIIDTSISFQFDQKHIMGNIKGYIHALKVFEKYGRKQDFAITIKDHLGYLLEKILLSNLSKDEIMNVFKKSEPIFECFIGNDLVPDKKDSIPFFKRLVNKQFEEALSVVEIQRKLIKSSKKLISIIIPVFNVENYITDALESIVRQTIGLENLEVIMVDDCSTDKSREIIDKYASKYENFVAVHLPENSGAAGKPRNIGIEMATNDYLMFLDPDDYFANNACELLYEKITKENGEIVFGKYVNQYENGDITKPLISLYSFNTPETRLKIDNKQLFFSSPPSIWTKIFKRNFIKNNMIWFPVGIVGQDLVFLTEAFLKAKHVFFINQIIASYRVRNNAKDSISFKRNYKYMMGLVKANKLVYDICEDNGKLEYFTFFKNHLSFWMYQFILSDLSVSEQKEVLKSASFIFQKHQEYGFIPPNHLNDFYDNIIDGNYDKVILFADKSKELIEYVRTPINQIKSNNLKKKIFILLDVLNIQFGGLAKTVMDRSNLLSKNGYDVSILSIEAGVNYNFIENELKKSGQLHSSVELVNIYDYFRDKNFLNLSLDKLNKFEKKLCINENDYQTINEYGTKRLVRYFQNGLLVMIKKWKSNGLLDYIDYFNKEGIKTIREKYFDGFLNLEISYYNNTKKVNKKRYFTKDGFCYLTEMYDLRSHIYVIYLFDRLNNNVLSFKNVDAFHNHFLVELCKNCQEKPYLICDGSGPTPSISNVDSSLAYKISQLHSNPYTGPYGFGGPIRKIGVLKRIGNNDAFITLTERQRKDILKQFGDYGNTYVIPNFVIKNELLNIDKNPNKISLYSRIAPEKNLEDAIKAFEIVVKKRKNAILEIFGRAALPRERDELKKIKKLIKKYKLGNNVFIKGHTSNVSKEMEESVATILTSHFEGFNLVTMESMLNSTPVISYDFNYGPNEIIDHDVNGFLVEGYNTKKLAKYIIKLLDDPEKAKKMGLSAREKVLNKYNDDVVISKWEKLLEQIKEEDMGLSTIDRNLDIEKYLENVSNENIKITNKIFSKFPTLYMLFKINKIGFKNTLINIKGYKTIKKNNLLDIVYYLNNNDKVRISGMDPILHYIYHGYNENKHPNPSFDGHYYLKKYNEVKSKNLNPLVHYALYGMNEGRETEKKEELNNTIIDTNKFLES